MAITQWSYTFISLPTSPGYLIFNPTLKYSNISCLLSPDYQSSVLSCSATHEVTGTVATQLQEVSRYCTDSCHNALIAFVSCMDNSGLDGSLVTRYWDSGCMKNPNNASSICLVERLKLLEDKSADSSVLSQNLKGPIACDACTRVSMQQMIDNYDYLASKPAYSNSMPSAQAVQSAKDNIQTQCGKPYSQLENDTSNSSGQQQTVSTDGLPMLAIILLIIAGVSFGAALLYFLYNRWQKQQQQPSAQSMIYQPSYSTLKNEELPVPQFNNNGSLNRPYSSRSSTTDQYYDDMYHNMRVTSFENK